MKKLCTFFIAFFVLTSPLIAEKMYILSNQANIKTSPTIDGETVIVLKHGEEVKVLETQSIWVKIQQNDKTGWVSKFSLSEENPLNQSVIDQLDTVNLKKNARRRASSYATAATTRGLNSKDGTTVTKSDYEALKVMELYKPSIDEVNEFRIEGELQK